jgi:predicted metalloendopeptidase
MATHQSNVFYVLVYDLESKARDEAIKPSKTDPHSPGMYRAYVPLQNVDTFIRRSIFSQMMVCILHQRKELKSGRKYYL